VIVGGWQPKARLPPSIHQFPSIRPKLYYDAGDFSDRVEEWERAEFFEFL